MSTATELRPWPADKVERRPLESLTPYDKNPRAHSEEQVGKIAESIARYGFASPLLADELGVLIYGHGRFLAAQRLGLKSVPVCIAEGWSEEEKSSYRIIDNQYALMSDWDIPMLSAELGKLALAEFDMMALGFTEQALAAFVAGHSQDPAEPVTPEQARKKLAESFGGVPFSVFNARDGWWQDRKRAWLALGIQSELGRGENLLKFSDSVRLDGEAYNERFKRHAKRTKDKTQNARPA
jgi:hypothetical protein